MEDYLKELEEKHNEELIQLKIQWETIKLQIELEKNKNPSMREKLDAYLNMLKNNMKELLGNDKDSLADYRYVFEEDYETLE